MKRKDWKGRREGRKDGGMKKERKEGGMKGVGRKGEKGEGRHNLRWGREDRISLNEWITLSIKQITENLINLFFQLFFLCLRIKM